MRVQDRYLFPAVFTYDDDGITVEFPDLPGCVTCGASDAEALAMAKEALGLHLYGMEVDGQPVPAPSSPVTLRKSLADNQVIVMVEVWMPPLRAQVADRSVKKTLTIPKWLNDLAERHGVNFSQVLQKALREHLGLHDR